MARAGSTATATSGWPPDGNGIEYLHSFARHHGLHSAQELLRVLDERLDRQFSEDGPYFFADLRVMTDEEERAAIEAGAIQAVRVDWVGTRR